MKNKLFRQRVFFFGMVLILIILTYFLIKPFIIPLLVAFGATVIMHPVYQKILHSRFGKEKESRATAGTLTTFILAIAIPLFLLFFVTISQAIEFSESIQFDQLSEDISNTLSEIETSAQEVTADTITIDEVQMTQTIIQGINSISSWISDALFQFLSSIPAFLTNAVVVLIVMWVLLPKFSKPDKQDIVELVPFPQEITLLFFKKINLMIVAMFKGIFVISIVQGLAMGVILAIAGVPFVALFTVISIFLALVPMIGISLIAWPIGIILILNGYVAEGIFVIGAFLIIVTNIDTVLRPRIVPKEAYLNPALVILSVFGGMQIMGLIGIFYGPVIMILLVTSIDVYTKYMLRSDLETLAQQGKIDLQALGLTASDEELASQEANNGGMMKSLKRWTHKFYDGPDEKKKKTSSTPKK